MGFSLAYVSICRTAEKGCQPDKAAPARSGDLKEGTRLSLAGLFLDRLCYFAPLSTEMFERRFSEMGTMGPSVRPSTDDGMSATDRQIVRRKSL